MTDTDEHIDYYDLLGVSQTATKKEIRTAYRRLALQWHPDKNQGAEEEAAHMFKRISEAYDVLSDDDKRTTYDRFGIDGLKGGGSQGPVFRDSSDLFREVFGDSFFSSFFGGRGGFFSQRGQQQYQDPFDAHFGSFFGHGQNGFDDDDHGHFSSGHRQGHHNAHSRMHSQSRTMSSPFMSDPFFSNAFGSFGNMSSFQASSFSSFPGSFSSISQSTSSTIKDGKRVTTTTTTRDGVTSQRVETTDLQSGEVLSLVVDGESQPLGRLTNGSE